MIAKVIAIGTQQVSLRVEMRDAITSKTAETVVGAMNMALIIVFFETNGPQPNHKLMVKKNINIRLKMVAAQK